jgi:hypothetical protein
MARTKVIGKKINRLTVLSEGTKISGGRIRTTLNCICECGKLTTVFKCGNTISCGCVKRIFKDQHKSKKNKKLVASNETEVS